MEEQEVSELTKHERVEKDKQINRTCPSPVISSAYQEHNSAHSAKVNTHPTSQSNQQRETPRLRGNPNANPTTSILHEGIRQTHQFSTDAPGYSEPSRYIPPTRTTQRQSANRAEAVNASRVDRRYWNNDDITISGPVGSTPFVQDSVLSSLVTTIEKIGISHDFSAIQIIKFDGSPENFPAFRQRFGRWSSQSHLMNRRKCHVYYNFW